MTEIRHEIAAADRAAVIGLRATLAANPMAITRASYDALLEQVAAPGAVEFSEAQVGGVPGVWCLPATRRTGVATLYLHGGVFALGSAWAYRHFVGHIAARSGVPAFVADYRLAPEHRFPAALEDARAAYR